MGAIIGRDAFSLIAYKIVQNNTSFNRSHCDLSINADKLNGRGSVSPGSKNSFMPEDIINLNNDNNSEHKTTYNITSLDIEQLKLEYALQSILLYLFVLVLIFLIMKAIRDRNLKSNIIEKLSVAD